MCLLPGRHNRCQMFIFLSFSSRATNFKNWLMIPSDWYVSQFEVGLIAGVTWEGVASGGGPGLSRMTASVDQLVDGTMMVSNDTCQ